MQRRANVYAGLVILTIAILAGGVVYVYGSYSAATAQVSSLKADGRNLCSLVSSEVSSMSSASNNITETMQQQVQQDNSIIAALNSTRPTGYASMITSLQDQQRQDLAIVSSMNDLTAEISPLGSSPCAPFK